MMQATVQNLTTEKFNPYILIRSHC